MNIGILMNPMLPNITRSLDILDLWNDLDQDIPSYCANERQFQNSWIDKIFAILGWTIELEESSSKHGITNFPDYALFVSHDDWKSPKRFQVIISLKSNCCCWMPKVGVLTSTVRIFKQEPFIPNYQLPKAN